METRPIAPEIWERLLPEVQAYILILGNSLRQALAKNDRLEQKVNELEERLNRNSNNSSLPPSHTILPSKVTEAFQPGPAQAKACGYQKGPLIATRYQDPPSAPKQLVQKKSGKKPGGQAGRQGNHREMVPSDGVEEWLKEVLD